MIWRHAGSSSSISSGMPQSSSTTCTSTPWDKPGRGGRMSRTTHPIRASTTATGPRHSGSTDNASTASRGRGAMSTLRMTRRHLLRAGFVAGATLSAGTVLPRPLRAQQPKRGGILRVRGYDPPHFDPHQTLNFKTNNTLSFVYNKLVRHRVGAGVAPGTFVVEPDLAERWEELDDTTVVFHLRRGVRWHNKPPVNGRELTADDVKFTYEASSPRREIRSASCSTPWIGWRPWTVTPCGSG